MWGLWQNTVTKPRDQTHWEVASASQLSVLPVTQWIIQSASLRIHKRVTVSVSTLLIKSSTEELQEQPNIVGIPFMVYSFGGVNRAAQVRTLRKVRCTPTVPYAGITTQPLPIWVDYNGTCITTRPLFPSTAVYLALFFCEVLSAREWIMLPDKKMQKCEGEGHFVVLVREGGRQKERGR